MNIFEKFSSVLQGITKDVRTSMAQSPFQQHWQNIYCVLGSVLNAWHRDICCKDILCQPLPSAVKVPRWEEIIWSSWNFSVRGSCCCPVARSCPALCDPMDCSTPGFPVLHRLLELCSDSSRGRKREWAKYHTNKYRMTAMLRSSGSRNEESI